jgi:hypothetical protein|tara:strand:- start:13928 stop:14218 length:291 start_codon:yes stop_codon:yes gene_type:complete
MSNDTNATAPADAEMTTTAVTEEVAAPVAPSVTVNDLVNVYAIIDLASKRGAFQAGELEAVGGVANRVKAFVDHVNAASAAASAAAEEAPDADAAV